MDLERLGSPRSAASFMRWYEEFSGVPEPVSLEHHKIAYRAFMRARVSGVRGMQGMQTEAAEARRLADLSLRHLRAARARLVLVGGAPGTGKSTLAGLLSDRMGATLLRADRVRKEVVGIDPRPHAPAELEQGICDRATTERTYDELLRLQQALVTGEEIDTADSADKAVEQATTVLGLEPLSDRPRRPNMAPD